MDEIHFNCPHCGESLIATPPDRPGDATRCPECAKQLVIPHQERAFADERAHQDPSSDQPASSRMEPPAESQKAPIGCAAFIVGMIAMFLCYVQLGDYARQTIRDAWFFLIGMSIFGGSMLSNLFLAVTTPRKAPAELNSPSPVACPFWMRIVSGGLDMALLALGATLSYLFFDEAIGAGNVAEYSVGIFVGTYVLCFFPAYESSPKGTLGSRLMGLQVVGVDGRRITFSRGVARNLARLVGGLASFAAFATPDGRALHDRLSGTYVVCLGRVSNKPSHHTVDSRANASANGS